MLLAVFRLVFGTLYPAYASYKAVKTKNAREYVKWMMYWIVFAFFTCTETFTDIFLSWFPFYYEIKILLVIWLLSPATNGSSILYRKFVHPTLSKREEEIDEYIERAKVQSYRQVLDLGSKGVTVLMQTAIKGGGGIVSQIKKSYSLSDLSDPADGRDETDDVIVADPRLLRRRHNGRSPHRSSSASSAGVYFQEVDMTARVIGDDRIGSVRSTEDISSGYSSGECLSGTGQPLKLQAREGLQRTSSLTRTRPTRVTRSNMPKKSAVASDESDENEEFDTNIIFLDDRTSSSASENEFFDSAGGNLSVHGNALEVETRNNCSIVTTACGNLLSNSDLTNTTPVSSAHDKRSELKPRNDEAPVSRVDDVNADRFPEKEHLSKIIQTKTKEITDLKTTQTFTVQETEMISNQANRTETRGGRYNKRAAPPPPQPSPSAIKAKLVLQPGIVRSLNKSNESIDKEVFLRSPNTRRKSRSRSKSPGPSTSGGNSLSKMLRFPKKLTHLNIPDKLIAKRHSWSDFFQGKNLHDTKSHSKSAIDVGRTETNVVLSESLSRPVSQMSIQNSSDSPLHRRRIKIIRRYVDEDID
ncbi:uncharacterized protein LOC132702550 isoform X2 [Cylas formicarius]|uniref:uncharacterized protein LOC132702550 isoform X2 n=1 Tax=Cylas formicarius TaxID=197179 RepID=UPI0029589266|nr:uncharacterized protein LOC132702550 isoform X2 [Cylas formicarius]